MNGAANAGTKADNSSRTSGGARAAALQADRKPSEPDGGHRARELDQRVEVEIEKLLREGFDLLADLTGDQPKSFEGLYQGWYTRALPLVASLTPSRADEFRSLYRTSGRRRHDIDTFGICDYLLGVSLHGGFGGIDVTRGIIARRFHQQLQIVKVAAQERQSMIARLRLEIAGEMAFSQISNAQRWADAGDHATASRMVAAAAESLIIELGRHHNSSSGARTLRTLSRKLADNPVLSSRTTTAVAEAAELVRGIAARDAQPGEADLEKLVRVTQELAGDAGGEFSPPAE